MNMYITDEKKIEKAVFVGIIRQKDDENKVMEYLEELEFLAETAGAVGDRKFVQRLDKPDNATYIRSGKLEEIYLNHFLLLYINIHLCLQKN